MPPDYETFSYEAMATHFAILIAGQPAEYARQASAAAFRELDRLENELSRYVESSDISQANRLAEGESTVIGEDALRCLLIAAQISEATGRAFDPAYASVLPAGGFVDQPLFALDPERHELTSLAPRLHLDLGAVGKGYALDRMADVLREWTIDRACLQSGGSTALVLEAPEGKAGWPLSLGEEPFPRILDLRHRALSGSGVAVKGAHLMDVRTGHPASRRTRVWAVAADAASSDALSTAFFVMTDEAVRRFCEEHPDVGAALAQPDGTLLAFGDALGPKSPTELP